VLTLLTVVALAACDTSPDSIEVAFDQSYTVPSDRTVKVSATSISAPRCIFKGDARYNPAIERTEISFRQMLCPDEGPQPFSGIAVDEGAEVFGVRSECQAGKPSRSADKPWICLTGRVGHQQSFLILRSGAGG
jgi:hypothetical protein